MIDRAQWFDIDQLISTVRVEIDSGQDRAHWFDVDRIRARVWLTSIAHEIISGFS